MERARQIARRYCLSDNSLRRISHASAMTAILFLAPITNAAADGTAVIPQTGFKSDPASMNLAKESRPNKPNGANRMATGNPLWAVPLKDLAATLDRPLFSPTRRPHARQTAVMRSPQPEPPVKAERPPLELIGTVVGDNGAIGIFRDQSTKRAFSFRSGERRYGWLLSKVHKRDVVLRKESSYVFLSLSADAAVPVVVAMQEPGPRLVRRQR